VQICFCVCSEDRGASGNASGEDEGAEEENDGEECVARCRYDCVLRRVVSVCVEGVGGYVHGTGRSMMKRVLAMVRERVRVAWCW